MVEHALQQRMEAVFVAEAAAEAAQAAHAVSRVKFKSVMTVTCQHVCIMIRGVCPTDIRPIQTYSTHA